MCPRTTCTVSAALHAPVLPVPRCPLSRLMRGRCCVTLSVCSAAHYRWRLYRSFRSTCPRRVALMRTAETVRIVAEATAVAVVANGILARVVVRVVADTVAVSLVVMEAADTLVVSLVVMVAADTLAVSLVEVMVANTPVASVASQAVKLVGMAAVDTLALVVSGVQQAAVSFVATVTVAVRRVAHAQPPKFVAIGRPMRRAIVTANVVTPRIARMPGIVTIRPTVRVSMGTVQVSNTAALVPAPLVAAIKKGVTARRGPAAPAPTDRASFRQKNYGTHPSLSDCFHSRPVNSGVS